MRHLRSGSLALGILLLLPAWGYAESSGTLRGWGPRVGLSSNPDQVYFGAHFDLGAVGRRTRLQPNVELGLGDGLTVLAMNLELDRRLREDWNAWTPYLGGGLGVITVSDADGLFDRGNHSDLGLDALFGVERFTGQNRFFMEAKLGLVNAPDLKVGIGWTFY